MRRTLVSLLAMLSVAAFASPAAASTEPTQASSYEGNKLNERFEEEFYEGLGNKLNRQYMDGVYEHSTGRGNH